MAACGFTDCLTYLLGGALVGTVLGVGGSYMLSGKKGQELVSKGREKLKLRGPEPSPATAGFGRKGRSRGYSGCGCGG